jgi:hypothetical protein
MKQPFTDILIKVGPESYSIPCIYLSQTSTKSALYNIHS